MTERDQGSMSVGRVLGSLDATPLKFHVALSPEQYLQLDDVVVTSRDVPGHGSVTTAGIVTEVTARHEGASFASDVFLISDGVLPATVQETAEVTTTRVEPEVYVPPRPGELVARATGAERTRALYFDDMEHRLPAGLGRDGEVIYLDLDFLDGTRGAHVSISGISGVATKTSYALFLLHSLFRSGALGTRAINAKALVFSVKGEDLLFLDYTNVKLNDDLRDAYAKLGLPAEPFKSAAFLCPPVPHDTTGRPQISGRTSGARAFWWTIDEFCAGELLPFVFADAEDERNQYTMVIHQVASRLKFEAEPSGRDGAVRIGDRTCRTYGELLDVIEARLNDEDTRRDWAGPVTGVGTINAFLRRLHSSRKSLDQLDPRGPARPPGAQGVYGEPAGHRHRPAQPAGARPALRRRRGARRRDGTQRGRRAGRPAVHHAR